MKTIVPLARVLGPDSGFGKSSPQRRSNEQSRMIKLEEDNLTGERALKLAETRAEVGLIRAKLARLNVVQSSWVIMPSVWWMGYWDIATSLALVFTALVTPYEVAMLETRLDGLFVVNRLIDLIFYVDIGLGFFSAFRKSAKEGGTLVTNHRTIRCHYLKGWFVIDISSMIPLDTVAMLQKALADDDGGGGGGGDADNLKGLRLMKLLKLMKLVRLVKVSLLLMLLMLLCRCCYCCRHCCCCYCCRCCCRC